MQEIGIGRLGIQDVLTDGSRWTTFQSTPTTPSQLSLYVPKGGIDELEFAVATTGDIFIDPYMSVSIGSQDIFTSLLDNFYLRGCRLSDSQIDDINIALSQAIVDKNVNGLDLVELTIKIGSSSTISIITLGIVMASYDSNIELEFSSNDPQ